MSLAGRARLDAYAAACLIVAASALTGIAPRPGL
jgi:hypothetical protein